MSHSHHNHREYQVSHRRVDKILQHEPEGAKEHATGKAFSNVTSKTGAEQHDAKVTGKSAPKRYARGGKVKHHTNISIVLPRAAAGDASAAPPPGPAGAVPMAGPGPSPMPMPPPGMPMRARGGKVAGGESTRENISKMGDRASKNSLHPKEFFRGGAASGVGREEKAEHMKRKGRR